MISIGREIHNLFFIIPKLMEKQVVELVVELIMNLNYLVIVIYGIVEVNAGRWHQMVIENQVLVDIYSKALNHKKIIKVHVISIDCQNKDRVRVVCVKLSVKRSKRAMGQDIKLIIPIGEVLILYVKRYSYQHVCKIYSDWDALAQHLI